MYRDVVGGSAVIFTELGLGLGHQVVDVYIVSVVVADGRQQTVGLNF